MKKISLKITLSRLILLAILLALGLSLARFSVGSAFFKVSPGFIVNTVIGAVGGPIWAGLTLAVGDVAGFLLSSGGFAFFPGYTFSALVIGLLYGFFFFGKRLRWESWQDWLYTFVASSIMIVIYSIILGTLWITIIGHMSYTAALFGRGRIFALAEIPIRTIITMLIIPPLQKIPQIRKFMGFD